MTPTETPRPDAPAADRLPWAAPTLTVIDLADQTHTGTADFSDETTMTTASRYAAPS